jgi:ABC-2 type transport system ATP-binding protein
MLIYHFDAKQEHTPIAELLRELNQHQIDFVDLNTEQSSLEDIFVSLVND